LQLIVAGWRRIVLPGSKVEFVGEAGPSNIGRSVEPKACAVALDTNSPKWTRRGVERPRLGDELDARWPRAAAVAAAVQFCSKKAMGYSTFFG